MEFGEKLLQLRKRKNMTQEELAEALFVSRTAISKWESGRGYPSIDSLKVVSRYFSVTVDELLSSEELLSVAKNEGREKTEGLRDLTFGILDCAVALLAFLPVFGQRGGDVIRSVSLLGLAGLPGNLWAAYIAVLSLAFLWGILELALQNCQNRLWQKSKRTVSLLLSIFGTLVFLASLQPYAAALEFFVLLVKGALLLKQR